MLTWLILHTQLHIIFYVDACWNTLVYTSILIATYHTCKFFCNFPIILMNIYFYEYVTIVRELEFYESTKNSWRVILSIENLYQWALPAMTLKIKNGSYSLGTLYGRPMEGLAFCYDRHEEITRYIRMSDMQYHPMVMHVFCLPLQIFGWFCYSRRHTI